MAELSRRDFVRTVSAVAPVAAVTSGGDTRKPTMGLPSRPLDVELLQAVGEAVLPSELGPNGTSRVVAEFQRWLKEYSPGAELIHPYGSGEIRHAAGDPAPRWNEQLATLDRGSHERFAVSFTALDVEARRAIVREALGGIQMDRLPAARNAEHVAVALLAYFYATPEAANLCYGAVINRYACRPLAESPSVPPPMRPESGDRP